MTKEQQQVLDFHKAFEIYTGDKPHIPGTRDTRSLRLNLIKEEYIEFCEATDEKDIVKVADALADLMYVVLGAACAHGIDMEPIFQEVHRSNMSKVGGTKRADGKLIKPDTYSPPNLVPILKEQGAEIV